MSHPVNIMVLCNNEMAFPAMQQLYLSGSLKAVVVPEKNQVLFSMLKQMFAGTGISPVSVTKKNLESVVKKITAENNITAAWMMTFAYIIPASLLNLLPGGFINFHYGLLPRYRGSNPVLSQMLQGETESGITVHIVDENIDTGPIVMQQKIAIEDMDTFGIQLQKLGMLGASMAMSLLQLSRLHPTLPSTPQDETKAHYFKKPVAADLMINWNTMNSKQVIRLINACNPWNKGAGAVINGQVICLTDAEMMAATDEKDIPAGTIISISEKEGLRVVCSDNMVIRVNIIYLPVGVFPGYKLAAFRIKINDRFITC